jgi:hypothetical protein
VKKPLRDRVEFHLHLVVEHHGGNAPGRELRPIRNSFMIGVARPGELYPGDASNDSVMKSFSLRIAFPVLDSRPEQNTDDRGG